MSGGYAHLGRFSDWADVAAGPAARAAGRDPAQVRTLVHAALDVPEAAEVPTEVRVETRWATDGIAGEEVSWSVGFGPRTHAWLLRPDGVRGPLPGVLALHGHDGFKLLGKEKIAGGPEGSAGRSPAVAALRETLYGGRAIADDLARAGFVVLVVDVLGWGSRRFELDEMPERVRAAGRVTVGTPSPDDIPHVPDDVVLYNATAAHHEHVLAKYCVLMGTTFAAAVAREDRIGLAYLRSRPDVGDRVGCVGLSGGGCRSGLLRATSDVDAAVVVGMMSTYEALLDHSVVDHTWMLFPAGLADRVDWPDVVGSAAPAPLMVQWTRDDALFPVDGARAADRRLSELYREVGAPGAYTGSEYEGPHAFTPVMQDEATTWLATQLSR